MSQDKPKKSESQTIPMKTPNRTFQKIIKQRRNIDELIVERKTQAQLANMEKSPRGKRRDTKPMIVRIELETHEHHFAGKPLSFRVPAKHAFLQYSIECICTADVVNRKAKFALIEGRMGDYFDFFAEAERCLGACVAWSSAAQISSLVAAHKSKNSRAEIDNVKKGVLDFLQKHIAPTISADNAAEIIQERYLSKAETGKEISDRTLAKWVRNERKAKLVVARKSVELW